jgi:xanthine dehydrogenase YagT iron-sulfur-binding subunit
MVERQLPKLHTRVRFPSPACLFGSTFGVGCFPFFIRERGRARCKGPYSVPANLFLGLMRFHNMAGDSRDPFQPEADEANEFAILRHPETRRNFIKQVAGTSIAIAIGPNILTSASVDQPVSAGATATASDSVNVNLRINGKNYALDLDPRGTLLDALRERLQLTGSKKGCDHGQCGACTVLVNGRRINACLTLAVMHEGDEVTTIEGLANSDQLHPMQAAFIEHDGFQCGYCTPGQICSAVACVKEGHANSDDEIREWMSGNICRCGAYPNILTAIKEAKAKIRA